MDLTVRSVDASLRVNNYYYLFLTAYIYAFLRTSYYWRDNINNVNKCKCIAA